MHFNQISGAVVDSAKKVHSELGPDFWRAFTWLVWCVTCTGEDCVLPCKGHCR